MMVEMSSTRADDHLLLSHSVIELLWIDTSRPCLQGIFENFKGTIHNPKKSINFKKSVSVEMIVVLTFYLYKIEYKLIKS